MSIKLLAMAASYRSDSLNRSLLEHAVAHATTHAANVTVLDYETCEAPLYRGEHTELPAGAKRFADALLTHDGLLLASPEYNWSVPGSLKNLIDWISVDERAPMKQRTALLMCATPSARSGMSGLQHLRVPLEGMGMWVYPLMVGIGGVRNDVLVREKDAQRLTSCVADFIRATEALCHAR